MLYFIVRADHSIYDVDAAVFDALHPVCPRKNLAKYTTLCLFGCGLYTLTTPFFCFVHS